MAACKSGYDPQEDSILLEKWVRQCAKGKVLDVGTGSGIQAIAASNNPDVKDVLAIDVQKGVVEYCKKTIKSRKIRFLQSDLFRKVKGKFDTIIFNPPYLPQQNELPDIELEGGRKGYEVIERFLDGANAFLNPDGMMLMVFSSLTKKEKVEQIMRNNLFIFEELEKIHFFFEDIYVYKLDKGELLKKLENDGISRIRYFAKGHRGFLFTGYYKSRKIAIKSKNPKSGAFGRISNESKWLQKLNRHKIGPRLLFSKEDYFAYEFVDGKFILEYLEDSNESQIRKIIRNIFDQMYKLDKLKIDKEEMHHPVKHVIIDKNNPVLIDFERAHYSNDPKNVTQFCQFITSGKVSRIMNAKGIELSKHKIIELAKIYKGSMNADNLKKITDLL